MILETLLGGVTGGLFRLTPELLRWLDRKSERAHELAMFDRQLEADKLRSSLHVQEVQAAGQIALDGSALDALRDALKGQAEMAVAAGGAFAGLSASVRPVATYWLLALYGAAKAGAAAALVAAGSSVAAAAQVTWGEADMAMLSGVLNFWFLDRVIRKQAA